MILESSVLEHESCHKNNLIKCVYTAFFIRFRFQLNDYSQIVLYYRINFQDAIYVYNGDE